MLAALIIADEEGADAVSALLPILGQPLIELQARQAHAAGAGHIVICTAQVPAGLVAALDRLRADQIDAAIVRTAREAADSIHPDEAVLLFGQGCAATMALVSEVATKGKTTIAVERLDPRSPVQELIDAEHGWAGLARIDGALVRKTSQIPGDWALGPTLLRLAVQAGAGRIAVAAGTAFHVRHVATMADALVAAQDYLSAQDEQSEGGLVARFFQPIGTLIATQLAKVNAPIEIVTAIPLLLLGLGVLGVGISWPVTALIVFLVSAIPAGVAQSLISASIQKSRLLSWYWKAKPWVGRLILLGVGVVAVNQGWGREAPILALWLVWMLWDGRTEESQWRADESSAAVLTIIGLIFGSPLVGIAAAIAHAMFIRIRRGIPAKN